MNVAQLRNAQPIQLRRKIRNRHIDALNRIPQPPGSKSIGCRHKRQTPREERSIAKKRPARSVKLRSTMSVNRNSTPQIGDRISNPLNAAHRLHRDQREERSHHPKPRNSNKPLAKRSPRNHMPKQGINERKKKGEAPRNQRNVQPRAPLRARQPRNPVPGPQKPEALHTIDKSKKYR